MTSPEQVRAVLRQGTKDYIAQDPTSIALTPRVKTHTDSGSEVWEDGTPRAAQSFKLISIAFTPQGTNPQITVDGVERIIGFYLLGAWDCVMEVGDHWVGSDGRRYEVIALMDGHGYETKGAVEAHG
jgi:hypothetical protein